jgi:hypothetical protein
VKREARNWAMDSETEKRSKALRMRNDFTPLCMMVEIFNSIILGLN